MYPADRSASTLLVGESLEYGQSLTSENGRYRFLVQTDGNLVLVVYDDNGVPYWASQTAR